MSSSEVSLGKSEEYSESCGREQIVVESEGGADRDRLARAERPDCRITPSKKRLDDELTYDPAADREDDQTPPTVCQSPGQQADDSLEVLAKIAARLEYMAADQIDITPDHLAQIDRAMHSLASLRAKEVVDAA